MVNEPDKSVNAIIAQALANAGVPPQNIEVPTAVEPVVEGVPTNVPALDGKPIGESKSESPEEKAAREADESSRAGAEKPPVKAGAVEPTGQLLSKADIEKAITEAGSKFQSIMDKKINQLQYQMTQTIGALNQFFQTQEESSIAGLPEEQQVLKRLERLEKPGQPKIQIQSQTQQPDAAAQRLYQYLTDMADVTGLKIDDKRLDWAGDLPVGQVAEIVNRFKASVKAALVEDQTKVIQALKDDGSKVLTKIRKQAGVDKVVVTGPSGAGVPDIEKMNPMQKIEYGIKQQEELSQVAQ